MKLFSLLCKIGTCTMEGFVRIKKKKTKTQTYTKLRFSEVALVVKNLLANAGDIRDVRAISELGRSRRGGYGNPLQYSCLENPRGTWWAIVDGITKSQTWLKQLSMHAYKIETQKMALFNQTTIIVENTHKHCVVSNNTLTTQPRNPLM